MKPRICITSSYSWKKGLFTLSEHYIKAIEKAGGVPYIIPSNVSEDSLNEFVESMDGLLLSGGGDLDPKFYGSNAFEILSIEPGRDEIEIELVRKFFERKKPIFAICRGIQVLNVAFGGTLHQEISNITDVKHRWYDEKGLRIPGWYPIHRVDIIAGTILDKIIGKNELWVNSTHHQAVKELGDGLMICSVSKDGIIEGIEHTNHPFILGVQWHPERMFEKYDDHFKLFKAFVNAARSEQ